MSRAVGSISVHITSRFATLQILAIHMMQREKGWHVQRGECWVPDGFALPIGLYKVLMSKTFNSRLLIPSVSR
eukprot:1142687-Pelagomonas_calceolata.AAC.2